MKTVIYQAPFGQTWSGFDSVAEYRIVWEEENHGRSIDEIWTRFQRVDLDHMPPEGYKGRSLSVGDVVSIGDDFWTPEPSGWQKLSPSESKLVQACANFYAIVDPDPDGQYSWRVK